MPINVPAPAFVAPPLPQFLPKSGIGGQIVTLNGESFNFAPVKVTFGTTPAIVSAAPSATQIAVIVPDGLFAAVASAKGVRITVTTPGGSAVSTDTFTVTGP